MTKKMFPIALLLLLSFASYAQLGTAYSKWTGKGKAFYEAKQYQQSAEAYLQAFIRQVQSCLLMGYGR